jgi:hypothetical protein
MLNFASFIVTPPHQVEAQDIEGGYEFLIPHQEAISEIKFTRRNPSYAHTGLISCNWDSIHCTVAPRQNHSVSLRRTVAAYFGMPIQGSLFHHILPLTPPRRDVKLPAISDFTLSRHSDITLAAWQSKDQAMKFHHTQQLKISCMNAFPISVNTRET